MRGGPPVVSGDQALTSFSYRNCTVSDVMGMPNGSYGFNILNERAQPVLSIGWTTKKSEGQSASFRSLDDPSHCGFGSSRDHTCDFDRSR
jgi:hypothetical protein